MDEESFRIGIKLGSDHAGENCIVRRLTGQFAEEFVLVQPILERLAPVDENNGNLIGELSSQLIVAVHVDLAQGKPSAAMQLGERFFHDLAQVAAFAGVNDHLAGLRHGQSLATSLKKCYPVISEKKLKANRLC